MRNVFFVFGLLITKVSLAVCPLCTFVVGAGIGLTQYLGIDDVISGIWIGGLLISLVVLTRNWFIKKNIVFYGITLIIVGFYYGSIILPFYLNGIMGHELNRLWGLDKLLLGIIVGSIGLWGGAIGYNYLKRHNNDRAYFPYQKVVMPLGILIVLSIVFYLVAK